MLLGAGCGTRSHSRISAVDRFQLLKAACARGDERSVRILLESGADPNGARDWRTAEIGGRWGDEFSSPMTAAAANANVEVMQLMLDYGAAVDVVEGEGQTPLAMAIYFKQKESVAFLLSKGADPTNPFVTRSLNNSDDVEIVALVKAAAEKRRADPAPAPRVTRR